MRLLLFVVIFLLKLFFLVLLVVFSEIIVSGATSVTFRNYIDPPPPFSNPGSAPVQLLSAVTQWVAAHFMSPSSEQCIIDRSALHTNSLGKLHKNFYYTSREDS